MTNGVEEASAAVAGGVASEEARAGAGGSIRARLPGLVLEAAMVVFAVLVALGVEEWREQRDLREFAARVRGAVEAEIDANLEELYSTREGLRAVSQLLQDAITAEDIAMLEGSLYLRLPEFSSAAWSAAQASRAAPHLDYAWVIDVGRAYEAYDTYSRISDQIIDAMGDLIGGDISLPGLRAIHGRLSVLVEVHDQVIERLENVAAAAKEGA